MSGERSLRFRTDCCNRDWEGEPYHMMRNVSKMDHRQGAMVQGYECRNCGAFHEQGNGGWKVLNDAEFEQVARAIRELERRDRERQRQLERRIELSEELTLRGYQNDTLRQMQSVSRTLRANSAPPQYMYFDEAETLRGMDTEIINKLFRQLSTKEEKKKERVDPWLQ